MKVKDVIRKLNVLSEFEAGDEGINLEVKRLNESERGQEYQKIVEVEVRKGEIIIK